MTRAAFLRAICLGLAGPARRPNTLFVAVDGASDAITLPQRFRSEDPFLCIYLRVPFEENESGLARRVVLGAVSFLPAVPRAMILLLFAIPVLCDAMPGFRDRSLYMAYDLRR